MAFHELWYKMFFNSHVIILIKIIDGSTIVDIIIIHKKASIILLLNFFLSTTSKSFNDISALDSQEDWKGIIIFFKVFENKNNPLYTPKRYIIQEVKKIEFCLDAYDQKKP